MIFVFVALSIFRGVVSRMSFFAASPLEMSRTARMRVEAEREKKCFAASRPRPVLLPVMRMVLPSNEVVGIAGGDHFRRRRRRRPAMA